MMILDTNVLSELMRPEPSAKVLAWFQGIPDADIYTTAVSQAEILYGLAQLPIGQRKSDLQSAASRMFSEKLVGRVLPFDSPAASIFAEISASRRKSGRTVSIPDGMIAGIARARGASIGTRNVADFETMGIPLVDPWA